MNFDEFFKQLWFRYPQDLCHKKKGSKVNAEKACRKLDPDQYQVILDHLEALKRYDRKDPKPDRWPFISSWINSGYYDREIGATAELTEKIKQANCKVCEKPVHGPNYIYCTDCAFQFMGDKLSNRRKEILVDLDLYSPGLSQSELAQNCRAYLKASGLSGMLSPQMKKDL